MTAIHPRGPRRPRVAPRLSTAANTVVAGVVALLFFLPALWIFIGSFRPTVDILDSLSPLSWDVIVPTRVSLDNYVSLLAGEGFGTALLNSLIVCAVSVAAGLVVSATAAYALSVFQFRGREFVFAVVVISFMVPFEAIAIPLSQLFNSWSLGNTLVGLPFIASAFSIFLFYTFFLGIPHEIEEAARLDGAGPFRTFFTIVVPMSKPAFATVAILTFLAQWGSYLWPVLMVTDTSARPLPLELSVFQAAQPPEWGSVLAFGVIFILPVLIVFLIFQRWFVQASMAGALKQ